MKVSNHRGRGVAVAVYDGRSWHLLAGADLEPSVPPVEGPADRLPQSLADSAVSLGAAGVLFLVSGDVHRIEGAIPSGMSLGKANEVIRSAIAEETGSETEGLVVAGKSFEWGGSRKPFTLAGRFDGDMVEDFRAVLADGGVAFAGIASLELAIMAAWTPRRDCAFAVIGNGQSFVLPATRGANSGPMAVSCGMRHFEMDPASWISRFLRGAAFIDKSRAVSVLVLTGPGGEVASAMREAGFADVSVEDRTLWLKDAARAALASRPNKLRGAGVPTANPWEPRRRFSNGWLVLAAVAVFALPVLFSVWSHAGSKAKIARCSRLSSQYLHVEASIKKAQGELDAARRALASEKAMQRAVVEMRRPLVAFIDVAYFFCRNSGESLVLDAIEQTGTRIEVCGTFSDPEDGVRLSEGLLEYARAKGLEIVKRETAPTDSGDHAFVNRFTVVLDCAKAGEMAK
ncbi:MAG: hypothetical protein K6G91_07905 [Kiritimatiellae bacterium]|nr:hypothetical protein [Kiritimatiellia bacterium]